MDVFDEVLYFVKDEKVVSIPISKTSWDNKERNKDDLMKDQYFTFLFDDLPCSIDKDEEGTQILPSN